MQIVYCEVCTKRIPPVDLDNKSAVFIDENQALCAACTAARAATQQRAPEPESAAAIPPAKQPTGTHIRPATARMEPRPATARRTTTMIKKGAASSGGMSSVKDKAGVSEPGKPPVAAIAGGGAAALCVILYLVFGGSSKATQTAEAKQPVQDTKANDAKMVEVLPSSEPAKPQMTPADAVPANPVASPLRKEVEASPLPPPQNSADGNSPATRRALDDKPAPIERAASDPKDSKDAKTPEPAQQELRDKPGSAPDVNLLLQKKDPPAAAPVNPADAPPAKSNALTDDTPDDPFNRDGIGGRKVAPATKPPEPAAAAKPAAPPAAANPPKPAAPKAAFVRGKQCELFPSGTSSHTDDIVDPRNNKPAKIDRFDGWIFNSQELTGMAVKDGVLSMTHQGLMQLDRFPDLEYKLQFEVQLGNNSALALQTGAAIAVSNLLVITDTHAMPAAWDTSKNDNNIKAEEKLSKPHGGAKEGWIPVTVSVHADAVDCIFGTKAPVRFSLPKTATLAQLGFLTLGVKGNTNPSAKIRKVSLYAP